jgi:hypothetical protein
MAGESIRDVFDLSVIYENEDADAVCAELAKRGVGLLNAPMDRNGERALPVFTTPDGHIWEVAQQLPDAAHSGNPRTDRRSSDTPEHVVTRTSM